MSEGCFMERKVFMGEGFNGEGRLFYGEIWLIVMIIDDCGLRMLVLRFCVSVQLANGEYY